MIPKRMFRADVTAIAVLLLIVVVYASLYVAAQMPGIDVMVDPVKGTQTFHISPGYRRPQFVSVEWSDTIQRVFEPAHRLDRILRPGRWPADWTVSIDAAELQRMMSDEEDEEDVPFSATN